MMRMMALIASSYGAYNTRAQANAAKAVDTISSSTPILGKDLYICLLPVDSPLPGGTNLPVHPEDRG